MTLYLSFPLLWMWKFLAARGSREIRRAREGLKFSCSCAVGDRLPVKQTISHCGPFNASQFSRSSAVGRFSIEWACASANASSSGSGKSISSTGTSRAQASISGEALPASTCLCNASTNRAGTSRVDACCSRRVTSTSPPITSSFRAYARINLCVGRVKPVATAGDGSSFSDESRFCSARVETPVLQRNLASPRSSISAQSCCVTTSTGRRRLAAN